MKTLTLALLSFALVGGAGSAALANDGPHNRDVTLAAYSDSFQGSTAVSSQAPVDQQSQATLDLDIRGEIASQHH